jgi:hypothetical protein
LLDGGNRGNEIRPKRRNQPRTFRLETSTRGALEGPAIGERLSQFDGGEGGVGQIAHPFAGAACQDGPWP